MEQQRDRKRKSSRTRGRMRTALAKLGHHVTDDTEQLVLAEVLPELEEGSEAPSTDDTQTTATTDCQHTGQLETPVDACSVAMQDDDGLIDVDLSNAVASTSLSDDTPATTSDVQQRVDKRSRWTRKPRRRGRKKRARDRGDAVTKQSTDGDAEETESVPGGKRRARRKRAKRYAKRAGVTVWKGLASGWKFFYSGLVMLTTSPAFTMNATGGIAQAWTEWRQPGARNRPRY